MFSEDMILVIDDPGQNYEDFYPWNAETMAKFRLDWDDVELLNDGEILWRGDIAFALEPRED